MQNLRIFFEKSGDAIYISHLDLMRCMTRAVVRAKIPAVYTEGFNPRLYMNFTMSLPLGFIGEYESVDIKVPDEITENEILEKLSKTMPRGIKVIKVCAPVNKASAVAFSEYEVVVSQTKMSVKDFNDAVSRLIAGPPIIGKKVGKSGKSKVVKEINLTENIMEIKYSADEDKNNVITMILPSNPQFGISPALVMERIFELLSLTPEKVIYKRKNMCTDDMRIFE